MFLSRYYKIGKLAVSVFTMLAVPVAQAQVYLGDEDEYENPDTVVVSPGHVYIDDDAETVFDTPTGYEEIEADSLANAATANAVSNVKSSMEQMFQSVVDSLPQGYALLPGMMLPTDTTIVVDDFGFEPTFFLPLIFDKFNIRMDQETGDPFDWNVPAPDAPGATLTRRALRVRRDRKFLQDFMLRHPDLVPYNMATMPRPPKKYVIKIDPSSEKLTVTELEQAPRTATENKAPTVEFDRINWLHTFDASLQFSQAYVSPNWYQGGKSNLNMIANLVYNIKLNQKFHPDVMFETNVAYKLGVNNAPDDTVHNYNISEDLFQINMRFGIKAMRHWYYSVNTQFKTQLLNSYRINSDNLVSSFLSPGQLNVGVGMTYSVQNRRNTVRFNASLAPLSYNLKTCTNSRLNSTAFGIEEGRTTKSEYGSSVELTFYAKIAYNITYNTRLFAFTNYEYLQGDWEHTVDFAINRFLTTRIYAHLRYDSQTKRLPDTRWHRWQLKEILSIGFSYRFSRI